MTRNISQCLCLLLCLWAARLPADPVVTTAPVADHPPISIAFSLARPGFVTLVIEDAQGRRVRNLISATPYPAGKNVAYWDGLDDLGRDPDAARHGVYHVPGALVAPGTYTVRGLTRDQINLRYGMGVYNPGRPPWQTADHTGGWIANHTPPQAALYLPDAIIPGSNGVPRPAVLVGSAVTEGGSGLAWLDPKTGRKLYGRWDYIGGIWTCAPFLARDGGARPVPGAYAYVGSAWDNELRLTMLTPGGDRAVLTRTWKFPAATDGNAAEMSGLAVRDGLMAVSLPKLNQVLLINADPTKAGGTRVIDTLPIADPRGLAFDSEGRLLVLSGAKLLRFKLAANPGATPLDVLIDSGLQDPQGITLDAHENIYISDWGTSHQVKIFSPAGKFLRLIGHAGSPQAGPYDPLHMNHPQGLTVTPEGRLWVTENDFQPKRVSVWDTGTGSLLQAFYGPSNYGGGGQLDPQDKSLFYYLGMAFHLDWATGESKPIDVLYRPGPQTLVMPSYAFPVPGAQAASAPAATPQTALYLHGRKYLTNCFNFNPTNGAAVAALWLVAKGIARPVAALGSANAWDALKGDAFKPFWPMGADLKADQTLFVWTDLNGDGQVQPGEVKFVKASVGGVTALPDLSFVVSHVGDRVMRYAPSGWTAGGAPRYDLMHGQMLATGAQGAFSSGGDQALTDLATGWTVAYPPPAPFSVFSVGGVKNGVPLWSYPNVWPGLHPSHESPPPDRPGELIGPTRILGEFIHPGTVGPVWAINGNMGNMYLMTADGLFIAQLFQDVRQGKPWNMPEAGAGLLLNDISLHDETFWPSITQLPDGTVWLLVSNDSLVRVDGLDSLRPLPACPLRVTAADLQAAAQWQVGSEAVRQQAEAAARKPLTVAIRSVPPIVNGKIDDWARADWATIEKQGIAAWFSSNTKPYDVSAAVAVSGDRLYAAWRTEDPSLLQNSGDDPRLLFKSGGALDVQIDANGTERLLVTQVKGKTLAMLYRAHVPGTAEPVKFSSPVHAVTMDSVEDVSSQVTLAGSDGNYEISAPLALLGLTPAPGLTLRGDIGLLRGNGFQTVQRVYWNNKVTGITADVPSEAELTPQLWGIWKFQ